MKKPLGCLTRSGLLAALLVLVLLAGVGLVWGGLPFSPGPLNAQGGVESLGGVQSHADIGGRCSACHVAFWSRETMSDRCVLCHVDIAAQLRDGAGLHGVLTNSSETEPCYQCHPEHKGSEGPLTEIDPGSFPHEATGYSLEGHQQMADATAFACTDCHGVSFDNFDLSRCSNCHLDLDGSTMEEHNRVFGRQCLACHDGLDTYGTRFDHSQTDFPLEGRHAPLACDGCHSRAGTIADLESTPRDCLACHTADDAHDGTFGADCAECHTAEGWEQATFDHNQSTFPLTGMHLEIACAQCHLNRIYQGTPQECASCHEDPAFHLGLLGNDCAECHDTIAWSPARYDRKHTFPTNHGEQGTIPCQTCHPEDLSAYTCYNCHEHDRAETEREHREEGINDFQDCMRCHPTGEKEEMEED